MRLVTATKAKTRTVFDKSDGTRWRVLIRAVIVCATAFGFELSAEQVAAIQLVAEAVIGVFVQNRT